MFDPDPTKTVHVTVDQLLAALNQTNGTKICSIVVETFPKLTVKDRVTKEPSPYMAGVSRFAHRNILIGGNYEQIVNKVRLKEIHEYIAALEADSNMSTEEKAERMAAALGRDNFRAEALWRGMGVGVEGQPYCVTHKERGGLYLVARPYQVATDDPQIATGTLVPVYAEVWRDCANGHFIDHSKLKNFLPIPAKVGKQELEHDVAWRVFGIQGDHGTGILHQLRYGGIHYVVQQ